MQDVSDFKCPFISKHEIWERVEDFRTQYWKENTLPVDIEKVVEKGMGFVAVLVHTYCHKQSMPSYLII